MAALARSFNEAADQIQKLVETQRHTLAAASHELREGETALVQVLVNLLLNAADALYSIPGYRPAWPQ